MERLTGETYISGETYRGERPTGVERLTWGGLRERGEIYRVVEKLTGVQRLA